MGGKRKKTKNIFPSLLAAFEETRELCFFLKGCEELTTDLLRRCGRVVPSGQRPLPVAAGGPGLQEAGERRGHAGPLQQLRLDDALPAPVQRHGEELEAVPPGRQHLGEWRPLWFTCR